MKNNIEPILDCHTVCATHNPSYFSPNMGFGKEWSCRLPLFLGKPTIRDIKAVKNEINMFWSNGAVEGHVNRIKSIKRQMYGRASFDLLRKKVILSQTG